MTGTGTVTFSSSNGYSGGTIISSGMLSISNDNQTGTGNITLAGGTLQTNGAVTSTKTISLTASTNSVFDTDGKSSSYGAISGQGSFRVTDSTSTGGTLTAASFTQTSTSPGSLTIDGGANLTLSGASTIYGNVTNNGNLTFSVRAHRPSTGT